MPASGYGMKSKEGFRLFILSGIQCPATGIAEPRLGRDLPATTPFTGREGGASLE